MNEALGADLEESNVQAFEAWKAFARALPAGAVEELPGLVVAMANTALPMLNTIHVASPTRDPADLQDRAERAVARGARSGVPWALAMCDAWLPPEGADAAHDALARAGLQPAMHLTGMVTDALLPPRNPLPAPELRPIGDEATRFAMADLNCTCYGLPLDWGRASIGHELFWRGPIFGCVAYVDGQPVSTSTTLVVDGRLYVGFVATAPEHRKKGYGEAAMRRSLDDARAATGLARTVLHATEIGRPLYEQMGYRAVAEFTWYTPPHA